MSSIRASPRIPVLLLAALSAVPLAPLPRASAAEAASGSPHGRESPASARVIGVDPRGLPLLCGYGAGEVPASLAPATPGALPPNSRGWETIPGVIRADGIQSFRLEVDANGPVEGVRLDYFPSNVIVPSSGTVVLHDDGLGEDRVAGDFIFTAGPFQCSPSFYFPDYYRWDPSSPAGITTMGLGSLIVTEIGGDTREFELGPEVGLLRADIPDATTLAVAPDVAATAHVVNVQTDQRLTQRYLRGVGYPSPLWDLTGRIYQVLPDLTDFFVLFSTDKIEDLQGTSGRNLVAGTHIPVRCDYTGTGLGLFDDSEAWGSQGVLQSVNILDSYSRGILSNVAVHELCHQWVAFTDPALGLGDGIHYWNWSSAASLVGGFEWLGGAGHTYTLNCDEGRNRAHHAPSLDQYMMGLLNGSQVPDLHVTTTASFPGCDASISSYSTVTIAAIQARHGVRSPGPEGAQRTFRVGFLAESQGRLLNGTEMAFYEILAAHFTRVLAPEVEDPYAGFNWVPVTRFFGGGTVWETYPTGVAFSGEPPWDAAGGPSLILRARPNPAPRSRGVELVVAAPSALPPAPTVEIFDPLGRRVAVIAGRLQAGGACTFLWDGRDQAGRSVSSGVYFARARRGSLMAARKLVLLE